MRIRIHNIFPPILLPILFFGVAILAGTLVLHCSCCLRVPAISWLDALFSATSATCVTGLAVVDTGREFSRTGQVVLLVLIQLGGLGIMSFTSLAFYLWKNRVSLTDRIAVGQSLLSDSRFHLGKFLIQIVGVTLTIELAGAALLFLLKPDTFSPFSALFHAVSAFCNGGFSLYSDSLVRFQGDWPVNLVIMGLVILGGLGFAVLVEGKAWLLSRLGGPRGRQRMSWNCAIVLQTSLVLIGVGWLYLYCAEYIHYKGGLPVGQTLLAALFQSVTCRTAGFNTLDIAQMTNASLVFMIFLMLVGGAPGSCAGGIKITTFRILWAFIAAQVKGREQVVIGKYAVDRESINKSLSLLFFSLVLIFVCVLLLDFSEGGDIPHTQARGQFLEILFEVVSAFGTVGLSTGLTPKVSPFGKVLLILLMFVGRLGPLVLLSALQSMRTQILYSRPEEKLSIG